MLIAEDHTVLLGALLAALMLDALIGDPPWLWRRLPHPVVLIGRLIGFGEGLLNRGDRAARLANGIALTAWIVMLAALIGWAFGEAIGNELGFVLVTVLTGILIAQRDLFDHVRAVETGLIRDGLEGGRAAVSRIVGRDPDQLDEAGVARAAIESLAENFSDGVVAPVFWYLLLGPAGLCGYKALNTLDSMIGHRSDRYEAFGKAAARADDVANWIPARIAALLFALVAGAKRRRAFAIMIRDAKRHRSPNAGWPEAAMAGALQIILSGPRAYHGRMSDEPPIGEGRADLGPADIGRALRLFVRACALLAALVAFAWVIVRAH